jgi:hypothetical protein
MAHRDGLSELSVRSQYRCDVGHHKMLATRGPKALKDRRSGRFCGLSGRKQAAGDAGGIVKAC